VYVCIYIYIYIYIYIWFIICPLFENLGEKFMGITEAVYIRVVKYDLIKMLTYGKPGNFHLIKDMIY